jgi:hypothetical protein
MSKGRSSLYTPELADKVCEELASGRTLRDVCRDEGMPTETTIRHWVLENREGFSSQYARAREVGYQAMADELLEIADNGTNDWMERDGREVLNGENVQRSRLRVDSRKWLLSKALPKVYGDKVQVGGAEDLPPVVNADPRSLALAVVDLLRQTKD